ncbi:hypothetical protein A3D78_06460 [Candidatus Gottesmanbacteria bacterium RIFCSPHIGHO2_02_FULL_39_14]|uniref:Uncharacterized protein n=1 Tax=Candidatus Gottesmanbacteria bacterium RIFCSPHIGHO2_02_FULL_39_14 TaxID=1798383 RepID=A0A1F5ZX21_9BACT|nr:MAG: hypothetical protein A3D78_06460 [Candidatus Gottesmanbacteria bacterium RIFCSPHIGHO2_02_FULL_39_14]
MVASILYSLVKNLVRVLALVGDSTITKLLISLIKNYFTLLVKKNVQMFLLRLYSLEEFIILLFSLIKF